MELSLILTDNQGIHRLNWEFRRQDKPTDVLSFPQEEDLSPWCREKPGPRLMLGDIAISLEKALEQAESYGHSLEREAAFLLVHGALHLLGYDHENPWDEAAMREEQRAVLEHIGIQRR